MEVRNKKGQLRKASKLSKRGQLRIQEMAFMIVAVFIFFVLVGLFALSIIYSNIQKQSTSIAEAQVLSSITNLASSPEFNCIGSKTNCVDADKLIVFSNNKNYQNYWPFTSLRVIKFNAFNKNEADMTECTLANYPDCDLFIVYNRNVKNEKLISSYVALCRTEYEEGYNYEKCEIAMFLAGSEVKERG